MLVVPLFPKSGSYFFTMAKVEYVTDYGRFSCGESSLGQTLHTKVNNENMRPFIIHATDRGAFGALSVSRDYNKACQAEFLICEGAVLDENEAIFRKFQAIPLITKLPYAYNWLPYAAKLSGLIAYNYDPLCDNLVIGLDTLPAQTSIVFINSVDDNLATHDAIKALYYKLRHGQGRENVYYISLDGSEHTNILIDKTKLCNGAYHLPLQADKQCIVRSLLGKTDACTIQGPLKDEDYKPDVNSGGDQNEFKVAYNQYIAKKAEFLRLAQLPFFAPHKVAAAIAATLLTGVSLATVAGITYGVVKVVQKVKRGLLTLKEQLCNGENQDFDNQSGQPEASDSGQREQKAQGAMGDDSDQGLDLFTK